MIQKFLPGQRVFIRDLSKDMSIRHFPHSREAIVMGTYSQLYSGSSNVEEYCLYLLDSNNHIYSRCSWYHEEDLSFVDDNIKENWELVEEYILKG